MRLRVKLLLIYGAVVLGGITVALIVVDGVAGRALRRSAERRLRQSAELLAEQAEKRITVEMSRLQSWATMPLVVQTVLNADDPEQVDTFGSIFMI